MKHLAWITAVILLTVTATLLLWEFRVAVILFILSLVIAATLRPLVDWFIARRLPRGIALLLTYAICVISIIALIVILGGYLVTDLQQLTQNAAKSYEQIRTQWPEGTPFQQSIAEQLPTADDLYATITGPQGSAILLTALGLTLGSFDLLGNLLISLVLSMYWSTDQEHFKRLWVSLLPLEMRAGARGVWQNIETDLGGYLRSQVIQSVLALILLSVGYQILGLKYPIGLAFIGTIGWLIPWAGVLIVIIPAVLVALSTSPLLAVLTAAFVIAVLSFLEFVVEPRLFNRRRFSSLLVVIMVLVLVDQFGLIGILIAPPMAAAIQIFVNQVLRSMRQSTTPALDQPINTLQVRLEAVQAQLAAQPESTTPELTNLVNRLKGLIFRATHA